MRSSSLHFELSSSEKSSESKNLKMAAVFRKERREGFTLPDPQKSVTFHRQSSNESGSLDYYVSETSPLVLKPERAALFGLNVDRDEAR